MKVPIICYHSARIGSDYLSDDHYALAEDLRAIHRLGYRIVPLGWVVDAVLQVRELPGKCVALTCDDGVSLDWQDVVHPVFGQRQSFANILQQFRLEVGQSQPTAEMTSFVVASPEARKQLAANCLGGLPWWSDDWWNEADASAVMRIENHSWDHVHPALPRVYQQDQIKGNFCAVDSFLDCDIQLGDASAFIKRQTDRQPEFFAYPYGQASRYLRGTYLPQNRHGIRAAFSIDHAFVTSESSRWFLPRFTHGAPDLETPDDLVSLLSRSEM